MTAVTEVRSASLRLVLHVQHIFANSVNFLVCVYVLFVCWYVAPPGVSYYNTLHVAISSHRRVWYRTLSLWCVYSKFGHHPHPLGYLCAKFHFFCILHCWVRPRRNIAYSITHSLNISPSLFDAPGTKAIVLRNKIKKCSKAAIIMTEIIHTLHCVSKEPDPWNFLL